MSRTFPDRGDSQPENSPESDSGRRRVDAHGIPHLQATPPPPPHTPTPTRSLFRALAHFSFSLSRSISLRVVSHGSSPRRAARGAVPPVPQQLRTTALSTARTPSTPPLFLFLCLSPSLSQVHLSHNSITLYGAHALYSAAAKYPRSQRGNRERESRRRQWRERDRIESERICVERGGEKIAAARSLGG